MKTLDTRKIAGINSEAYDLEEYNIFLGYYQDLAFLQNHVDTVLDEIVASINRVSFPSKKFDQAESIMHIRGGDYLESRHRLILGVLNSDYYSCILEYLGKDLGKNPIVVTDDVVHTQSVLPKIDKMRILGPNQANEWESFQIIANSKLAVIANSTFSWWAGMVVLKRGGRLLAPYPWTIKENESGLFTSNVFADGMEKIPSSFSH